jgi:hypothetical protein
MEICVEIWNEDRDQTIVYHNDIEVWSGSSTSFDQYLRYYVPRNTPVTLTIIE